MNAPSLAGFTLTPPRLTSSVSSIGVMTRLAPVERSSWLILSPIPAATAIMAVAIVMPSVMARKATILRRFCRRNDSNKSRKNMSVRELTGLGSQVGDADHNRVAVGGRSGMKRYGIASTGLTDALGIHRRRAVLADDPLRAFVKPDAAADLAGVEDRGHSSVRLAIEEEADLRSIHVATVAPQFA